MTMYNVKGLAQRDVFPGNTPASSSRDELFDPVAPLERAVVFPPQRVITAESLRVTREFLLPFM